MCVRACYAAEQKWHKSTCSHLVVQIFDAKWLSEVSKDLWAVLLELEVAGEVFPVERIRRVSLLESYYIILRHVVSL